MGLVIFKVKLVFIESKLGPKKSSYGPRKFKLYVRIWDLWEILARDLFEHFLWFCGQINYEKNELETRFFWGTTEIIKDLGIEQNLRKGKGGKRKFTQKVKEKGKIKQRNTSPRQQCQKLDTS